jgi:hypothetical protein
MKKGLSTHQWINRTWHYSHTVEYDFLVMKEEYQWVTPIIPATWKAETGRIKV